MTRKSTEELEKILNSPHGDIRRYLAENREELLTDRTFSAYMKQHLAAHRLTQQDLFLRADISEGYGYKLLSGEKRTRQRDVILRLCYAAEMTLAETQKALHLYGLPELYARAERDAVMMIAFNQRPGDIIDFNAFLKSNGQEMLRSSGAQD